MGVTMQKTVAIDRRTPLERNLDDGSDTLETIQHFADKLELSIPDTLAVLVESMNQLADLKLINLHAKRDAVGMYLYCRLFVRKNAQDDQPADIGFSLR